MAGSLLGNAVRRVEDPALLRGLAQFVDDLEIPGVLHATFVRSPFPHAEIGRIDTADAAAAPGVVAVFTAESIGIEPSAISPAQPTMVRGPLATGRVRYAGDPVALVVATSTAAAVDAAELVEVEYEPLDAVTELEAALAPDAPLLYPEIGSNLMRGAREPEGTPDPLLGAEVIIRGRYENQRVAVAPMEPSAIAVVPGVAGERVELTIYISTQAAHWIQSGACAAFGLEPDQVHVVAPWVGGGFGGKMSLNFESTATIAAARALGRPVKWIETRSENLVSMNGRSQIQYAEMGFRRDGTIVGLANRIVADDGAYAGIGGMLAMFQTRSMAPGVYKIPAVTFDVAAAATNTSPTSAFRGAGRPEATALLERTMDIAADELGIDPVEIRRRNFIAPDEFPFTTVTGALYDSGDYDLPLREALRVAGYDELRAEQALRRARGDTLQLGIGVASYVEVTAPGGGGEYGHVEITADGGATVRVGTVATGQGHSTAFSTIVSDTLGIPIERIRFIQGDTAEIPRGGGSVGSRSLQLGGVAVSEAAAGVLERGRVLAAELLEAEPEDIIVADGGGLGVAGVPSRSISWSDLAARAVAQGAELSVANVFTAPGATYPFGAHVSVVEVDTETGKVRPIRHIAVDDAGRILNPLLAAGQQHGGAAQGMAQALWEIAAYDESANPQTGTFATYCIPSAAEVCFYEASNTETPTPYNPLGAKGIGESATIGATPAVHNAVVDAVSHLGVRHIDMPCTPERVWRAITEAASGSPRSPWREPTADFSRLPARAVGA